jgi:hypothetical protein
MKNTWGGGKGTKMRRTSVFEHRREKNMKRRDKLQPIITEVSFAFHQVEDHLPW